MLTPIISLQSRVGSQSPSDDTDSPSPGLVRTYSYDKAIFDFRRVPPEKIAVSNIMSFAHIHYFVQCSWFKSYLMSFIIILLCAVRSYVFYSF